MLQIATFQKYQQISLLVTHYNRSESLERLLNSFKKLNMHFFEIIISDDGSKQVYLDHIETLRKEFNFRLITTEKNKGLGHNINKGQDAVNSPLTLYVQEDFEPMFAFKEALDNAYNFIESDRTLDLVRFYANVQYPYTKKFKSGFSKISIPLFASNYSKIYAYSDTPHLRRSNFLEKFGRYTEGIKGDRTEYRMCISFLQKKGKCLIYDNFKGLFLHENLHHETSTMKRSTLTLGNNIILSFVRSFYRQVRYNFDLLFSKY